MSNDSVVTTPATHDDECDLSELDKKILRHLQENGKASLRSIAETVDASVSAVKNHVDKLTEQGIIKAYTALIDCCKIGYKEMLLFFIRVNNSVSIQTILDNLSQNEKINAVYQISGNYPVFCMAKCIAKEDQIKLLEEVQKFPGIEEIHTQVVLQRAKEDMRITIP